MRLISLPRLVFIAVFLFVCGCSSSNKGQIEGTKWTSQAAADATQLEFNANHKLVLKRGAKIHKGTYSLGMGPTVTFTFEDDYEGRKIHAEKVVINGDQLTMTNPNGSQTTFQKTN
ncbi:MAG TPA: hypothetical protein VN688_23060 [Gemmataceae bacterium]|nr:hypothetical protein [Gemmataceae bacterium]